MTNDFRIFSPLQLNQPGKFVNYRVFQSGGNWLILWRVCVLCSFNQLTRVLNRKWNPANTPPPGWERKFKLTSWQNFNFLHFDDLAVFPAWRRSLNFISRQEPEPGKVGGSWCHLLMASTSGAITHSRVNFARVTRGWRAMTTMKAAASQIEVAAINVILFGRGWGLLREMEICLEVAGSDTWSQSIRGFWKLWSEIELY